MGSIPTLPKGILMMARGIRGDGAGFWGAVHWHLLGLLLAL